MSFKEALERDKAVFINEEEFAIPVVYKRKGLPDLAISGVFSHQEGFDTDRYRGGAVSQTGLLVLWVSDLAKPEYGDLAIINGEEWKVMPNIRGGDISWVLEVSKNLRPGF